MPPLPTSPHPSEPPDSREHPVSPGIDVELAPGLAAGYAVLVTLSGEHDLSTSGDLRAALEPIFGDVLVDLSPCEFIDSTIIGVLLEKLAELKREGCRLELVVPAANSTLTRVVEVVGMRGLLTVHDGVPGAGA